MKAICDTCLEYRPQEQIDEYVFQCAGCGAENDKNDLHHDVIEADDWCGEQSCPACQGYSRDPYETESINE